MILKKRSRALLPTQFGRAWVTPQQKLACSDRTAMMDRVMAFATPAATAFIFQGIPALLLFIALVRSLKSDRRAALVYLLVLAGGLIHLALSHRETGPLPAAVRIEQPDRLPDGTPQVVEVRGHNVLKVQAPARFEWTLRGDERRLDFAYGFVPAAYEQGTTDGSRLILSLQRAGVVRTIFQRQLSPREHLADREPQEASLILPPVAPEERLVLDIDAGPDGNDAWDWLYLARVGFQRSGTFAPEQFPSFTPVPETAEAPFSAVFQNRDRPFFLQLHAPAAFAYTLRGSERQVRFRYGFLAGSYQNGNATDGARFVVRLQRKQGDARILFDRLLTPLTRLDDRGPQSAELSLGLSAAGDRLIFGIEPGPAGSNSWDWTYISHLSLE